MKGLCGYGRYDDDPAHVGCPRAKSDMTPCIARDGALALADELCCVGCGQLPTTLLREIQAAGVRLPDDVARRAADAAADCLRDLVRVATEPQAAS
jgi:hypothetical protein